MLLILSLRVINESLVRSILRKSKSESTREICFWQNDPSAIWSWDVIYQLLRIIAWKSCSALLNVVCGFAKNTEKKIPSLRPHATRKTNAGEKHETSKIFIFRGSPWICFEQILEFSQFCQFACFVSYKRKNNFENWPILATCGSATNLSMHSWAPWHKEWGIAASILFHNFLYTPPLLVCTKITYYYFRNKSLIKNENICKNLLLLWSILCPLKWFQSIKLGNFKSNNLSEIY